MKSPFLLLAVVCFFAFSGSPMQTSELAEKNQINMTKVKIGMNENELREAMGNPYKIKTIERGDNSYKVFYYVTKGTLLGQTQYIDDNFTPIILKNGKITGWGNLYYQHYFDMDNLQKNQIEENKPLISPKELPNKETEPQAEKPKTSKTKKQVKKSKTDSASNKNESTEKRKTWFSDLFPTNQNDSQAPDKCKDKNQDDLDQYWWD